MEGPLRRLLKRENRPLFGGFGQVKPTFTVDGELEGLHNDLRRELEAKDYSSKIVDMAMVMADEYAQNISKSFVPSSIWNDLDMRRQIILNNWPKAKAAALEWARKVG